MGRCAAQRRRSRGSTTRSDANTTVDDAPKIFIWPNPYNEHVTFHDILKRVREIPGELGGANLFFVEDVAYQKTAIQELERLMLPVIPMKPKGDKRARLRRSTGLLD